MWPEAWSAVEIRLRDGRRVLLSPIAADDKEKLLAMLDRMSQRSRYLRYHSARATFSASELTYLTEVDYAAHFAWVATAIHEPGAPIVGVARYIRIGTGRTAEFAVAVVDEYQGVGLGRELMEFLGLAAAENGIARLEGDVLAENHAALATFTRLGGHVSPVHAGTRVVAIPVPLVTRRRSGRYAA